MCITVPSPFILFWMNRSPQPAGSTPTEHAAVWTLSGEAHARCRRHPERLRLGLHSLSRTPVDAEWDELWDKHIVGFESGQPALNSSAGVNKQKTIQQKVGGTFF